jgi:ATP-dependent phosphofructokinase / diphosphate-dependent phosphofructokinase
VTVLGHVQRGGSPTPRDRVLATRYGLKAADLVHEERWGTMAALHGDSIVEVTLADAVAELKTVPPHWYDVAKAFFG